MLNFGQLWRTMAKSVLASARTYYQRWWDGFVRTPGRTILDQGIRIDSTSPLPPHVSVPCLAEPLNTRFAGRAVAVALIVENYGGAEKAHLLSIGPSRPRRSGRFSIRR